MRSAAQVKGHPLHPMLVAFPAAYLVGSAAVDVCASAAGRRDWLSTARHLNALGIASALVAAVPGLVDYLSAVPPRSTASTRATRHMLANVGALALFATARAGRRRDHGVRWWGLAAEVCGAGLIGFAGWLGGTLVYRNQIGVDHRYAKAGKWRSVPAARVDPATIELPAAAADDLEANQLRLAVERDQRIALACTDAGLCAISDRCTHRGGPLSDGTLVGRIVQCPWHGSQFDVTTGAVRQGPATEPVESFSVTREGDALRIRRRQGLTDRESR